MTADRGLYEPNEANHFLEKMNQSKKNQFEPIVSFQGKTIKP